MAQIIRYKEGKSDTPKGQRPVCPPESANKNKIQARKACWYDATCSCSIKVNKIVMNRAAEHNAPLHHTTLPRSSVTTVFNFASTDLYQATNLYQSLRWLAGGGTAACTAVKCMEGRDATSPSRNVNRSELTVWYFFFDAAIDPKRLVSGRVGALTGQVGATHAERCRA
ncbi:hypothetical protein GE21DRAFT_1347276 [Neurospora crassa]|nr:hypothetical protein GE21DRAFT_1347276 [Neurospora crassa]